MISKFAIRTMLDKYTLLDPPFSFPPQSIVNLKALYESLLGSTLNEFEIAKFAAYFYAAHNKSYKEKPDNERTLSLWNTLVNSKDPSIYKYTSRGFALYQLEQNDLINDLNRGYILALSVKQCDVLAQIMHELRGEEGGIYTLWTAKPSLLTQKIFIHLIHITRKQGDSFKDELKKTRDELGYDYLAQNIDKIVKAVNPERALRLLERYKRYEFWAIYEHTILAHPYPQTCIVADVYAQLYSLRPDYVARYAERILSLEWKYSALDAVKLLNKHWMFVPSYFDSVLSNGFHYDKANALIKLGENSLLGVGKEADARIRLIFSHKNIESASNALINLNKVEDPWIHAYKKQIFASTLPEHTLRYIMDIAQSYRKTIDSSVTPGDAYTKYKKLVSKLLAHPNPDSLMTIWSASLSPESQAFVVEHMEICEHREPLSALKALEQLNKLGLMRYKVEVLKNLYPLDALKWLELMIKYKFNERECTCISRFILDSENNAYSWDRNFLTEKVEDFMCLRTLYPEIYSELIPTILERAYAEKNKGIFAFYKLRNFFRFDPAPSCRKKEGLRFIVQHMEKSEQLSMANQFLDGIFVLMEHPEQFTVFLRFADLYLDKNSVLWGYITKHESLKPYMKHLHILIHPQIIEVLNQLPRNIDVISFPSKYKLDSAGYKALKASLIKQLFKVSDANDADLDRAIPAVVDELSRLLWKHPALALIEFTPTVLGSVDAERPFSETGRHTFYRPSPAGVGASSPEDNRMLAPDGRRKWKLS